MQNFIVKSLISITDSGRVTTTTQQLAEVLGIRNQDLVQLVSSSLVVYPHAIPTEFLDADNDGVVVVAYRLTRIGFMRATRRLIGAELSEIRHRINQAFLDYPVHDPYESKLRSWVNKFKR